MVAPEQDGQGIPVGWFLLPNKKAKTYELMLKVLLDKLGGQPDSLKTVVSDFESAIFKTVKAMLKNIDHKGCKYHKHAAIWKNLGEHGLQSLYHRNPRFVEHINMLFGLCYVREDDVVSLYMEHIFPEIEKNIEEDEEWSEFADELNEFGDYYESTWIERRNHRPPRFPPMLWNHHDSILHDGVQTNNHLEAYNRKLNKLAGKSSNVWEIQDIFVKQEAEARRTFMSNRMGSDLCSNTGRKERSKDGRAAIKLILQGYDTVPKIDLLRMLAHSQ